MQYHKKGLPRSGFTLFELCLVLTVLGSIIALTYGTFISSRSYIHAELDRLRFVCCYLQRKAVVQKKGTLLYFSKHGYSGALTVSLPQSITIRTTFKDDIMQVSQEGTLSSGTVYLTEGVVRYALTIDVSKVRGLRAYRYDDRWVCLDGHHQVH